jgi:hypothetical protein
MTMVTVFQVNYQVDTADTSGNPLGSQGPFQINIAAADEQTAVAAIPLPSTSEDGSTATINVLGVSESVNSVYIAGT